MNNIEKKYSKSSVGKKFTTNEGYECNVIDGGSKPSYCTIRIGSWVTELAVSSIKSGAVKYPYHHSVFNVGYLGVGKYRTTIDSKPTKVYAVWVSMLQRCYEPKTQAKYPTYKNVVVDKNWHNFQTFAKWFEENYQEDWEIDKDLLSPIDNKIYSPNTCVFLPKALNGFLTNNHNNNTSGHIGVARDKRANKWVAQIRDGEGNRAHLGYFTSKEEASNVYKLAREKYANKWQESMQGILPSKVIANIC